MDNITALNICEALRQEKFGNPVDRFQCYFCSYFTKKDPTKKCFARKLNNTGCRVLNKFIKQLHVKFDYFEIS